MKTYPITTSGTRVLLIDLDNCPKQIDLLHQALAGITRAVACYGGVEPKVQVGLVPLLAAAINEGKLDIIKMEKKGRNAADFGLAFWAGRLTAELPPETEFIILSQDGDLDHVVSLLRHAGRKVERIDGKTSKIEITPKPASAKSHQSATTIAKRSLDELVEDYCRQQLRTAKTRPVKKSTLMNSIKSCFKKHKDVNPEKIMQALLERGIIAIDEKGRVTYPKAASASPSLATASDNAEFSF